ncbi:MAG: DUF1553 domain-containing protein, partial [Verrucomicrobiota bacterium]
VEIRRNIGWALLLCGISTAIGFSSLMWAKHGGLPSLGVVCALGIVLTMFTAVFLRPHRWRAHQLAGWHSVAEQDRKERGTVECLRVLAEARRVVAVRSVFLLSLLLMIPFVPRVAGEESGRVDFEESIRPLFNRHCTKCHGGVKQAGGVSFIYRERALGKGDSGRTIVRPGDPADSELIHRITTRDRDDRMPPVEESPEGLAEEEIALLQKWIEQGAEWRKPWSLEAPVKPSLPSVDPDWSRTRIDRFVAKGLVEKQLEPASEASAAPWLRRATLTLTGLPPGEESYKRFFNEVGVRGERAFEEVVDRLLGSPAFGERWASNWLDQIRYADSKGLGVDDRRTIWPYRDWVIRALNEDLPFDQFTIDQLAGDLLPDPNFDQLIATACHRNTQASNEGGTDDEEFRVAAVIDRVNTTWQVWQATTFGCVQCHGHPYDPFSHEDYYSFMAFFNNTEDADRPRDEPLLSVPLTGKDRRRGLELDRTLASLEAARWEEGDRLRKGTDWKWAKFSEVTATKGMEIEILEGEEGDEFRLPVGIAQNGMITLEAVVPAGVEKVTALQFTGAPLNPETALADSEWGFVISRLEAEWVLENGESTPLTFTRVVGDEPHPYFDPEDSLKKGKSGFGSYNRINHPRVAVFVLEKPLAVKKPGILRVKLRHEEYLLGSFPLVTRRGSLALTDDERWTAFPQRPSQLTLSEQWKAAKDERRTLKSASLPVFRERVPWLERETRLFVRGNYLDKEKVVLPRVPDVMAGIPVESPSRLDLAHWLVGPENPLTARVTVNRFWEQVFGRGIVATLEDFGSTGEKPTHPELLDDLALRFQNEMGWSVKRLLRELVLSSTFRQDSRIKSGQQQKDPDNRWLSRGPRNRLSAEMLRDQALALSGLLTRKLGGEPVRPPIPEGVWQPFAGDPWKTEEGEDRFRRAIYTYTKRSIPYPSMAAFDAPSREFCASRRMDSNTPLQALVTLNDRAFAECAVGLAGRMRDRHGDPAERIRYGYFLARGEEPSQADLEDLLKLDQTDPGQGLTLVASVLLNLDQVLTR